MNEGKTFLFTLELALLFALSSTQLYINTTTNSFSIFFKGIEIFHQEPGSPIFNVGIGTADFTETSGNFLINDTIIEETPIDLFDDVYFEDTIIFMQLSSAVTPSIMINFSLSVVDTGDTNSVLRLSASTNATNEYNRIWMNIYGEESEKLYGAGEQFSHFNLKGYSFPIWTSEQGIGRDDSLIANLSNLDGGAGGNYYSTYWPQASYLSTRKYSLLLSNKEYLVMDFENPETNTIYAHSDSIFGTFLFSPTINSLVPFIAQYIGLQPSLPDWIMRGAILGLEGGTDDVKLIYREAESAGVDVSGLWIQDWSGSVDTAFGYRVYWNWMWDETYYPGLDTLIAQLDEAGVKVLTYCNCHLVENSIMFKDAEAMGYLMTDSDGNTFLQDFIGFMAGTVDLLNMEAKDWYRDQLKTNIVDLGIYGWMADFGEYISLDMVSKNDTLTPEEMHNYYPILWAETTRDILRISDTEGSIVPFMRSGGLGSSSHQVLAWAGDQNVDFSLADGIASTIVAALSLSVSGMGVTHFDIGGFTSQAPILKRSEELLLRSAEHAVFTPVMRSHLGNKPTDNWQIFSSKATMIRFARLTKIHTRLFNYTQSLIQENALNGIPVQRPMFFHYEDDANTWDIMFQYMYGPDLIVAPVINEAQNVVDVYVPEGDGDEWLHLWKGLGGEAGPFVGPKQVSIRAPLGLPAVLYRSSSTFATLFESINEDFGAAQP